MVRPHAKRPFCPEPSVTLQVLRLRRTRVEDAEQNATEPTSTTSKWIASESPTRTKPLARRTLRVGERKSWVADVVWVAEKGDSCDPFTQNHAGGTPAPQLLCHHDAQLPASRG